MKKKKYIVRFNADPDAPESISHIGRKGKLTTQDKKEFTDLQIAVNFYMECTDPIDQLKDIATKEDWIKTFNKIDKIDDLLEAEQYYYENRDIIYDEAEWLQ